MVPRVKGWRSYRNVTPEVSAWQARFAEWHVDGVERQGRASRRSLAAMYHPGVSFFPMQIRHSAPAWQEGELEGAIARVLVGLVVAYLVFRLVRRAPWPRPFRFRFLALHIVAAPLAATAWFTLSFPLEMLVGGTGSDLDAFERFKEIMVVGVFLYIIVAGISYSSQGAARAAQAEALAAQTQLAALRAQLQPHFLFNALHTVVQLIRIDQRQAAEAAEMVADLLRRTLEERRDEVPLADEWRFVSRYLAIEQMRFGDRLIVREDLPESLLRERVPSFALQTLVENAVQHGAAPRVSPTEIRIAGSSTSSELTLSVYNTRDGGDVPGNGSGAGTGLARLREQLSVLHGGSARLSHGPSRDGGYEAVLTVPRRSGAGS
jgi:hypothetical protein